MAEKDDVAWGYGLPGPEGEHFLKVHLSTPEEIRELNNKTHWLNLIWQTERVDVGRVMAELEEALYRPDTPANDKYEYRAIKWSDMLWSIASMPWVEREPVSAWLQAHGIRLNTGFPLLMDFPGLKNPHGQAHAIGAADRRHVEKHGFTVVEEFPLNNSRSFGIQPVNDKVGGMLPVSIHFIRKDQ